MSSFHKVRYFLCKVCSVISKFWYSWSHTFHSILNLFHRIRLLTSLCIKWAWCALTVLSFVCKFICNIRNVTKCWMHTFNEVAHSIIHHTDFIVWSFIYSNCKVTIRNLKNHVCKLLNRLCNNNSHYSPENKADYNNYNNHKDIAKKCELVKFSKYCFLIYWADKCPVSTFYLCKYIIVCITIVRLNLNYALASLWACHVSEFLKVWIICFIKLLTVEILLEVRKNTVFWKKYSSTCLHRLHLSNLLYKRIKVNISCRNTNSTVCKCNLSCNWNYKATCTFINIRCSSFKCIMIKTFFKPILLFYNVSSIWFPSWRINPCIIFHTNVKAVRYQITFFKCIF